MDFNKMNLPENNFNKMNKVKEVEYKKAKPSEEEIRIAKFVKLYLSAAKKFMDRDLKECDKWFK
jgi:hypothetical protein